MAGMALTRGVTTSVQPAVRQAVAELRKDCLAHEAGTHLGNEDELLERYGISRPTLRQAAALVGQEQLLLVRRGPGGGYFAHRPQISSVSHMAAIFLQIQDVSIAEILLSTSTIRAELAPLAAANLTEPFAEELGVFLEQDATIPDDNYEFVRFLRAERHQNDIIGRASGNRVLHLYMQISLELAGGLSKDEDILFDRPSRLIEWRHRRNRMLNSILQRDPDIARLEALRCASLMSDWLAEDAEAGRVSRGRGRREPRIASAAR
jgi:DNA-binding FadR family transcriptional regulator